jgi:exodeoxyribonuclease VIII
MSDLHSWEGPLPIETNDEYHTRKQYSSTQIKYAAKSGWHFKRFVIDGDAPTSDSMAFGTLAHECIFEDNINKYKVMPKFSPIQTTKIGKSGKDIKHTITAKQQTEKFLEKNRGSSFIGEGDFEKLQGMKHAFEQDAVAQSLIFEDDLIEQGYAYFDTGNQVECRFRPDRMNLKQGHIIDYKTCADASPGKFKWSVINYGYDVSAAHYMLGAERLFPGQVKYFYLIAQETKPPYACATYRLSKTDLMIAKEFRSSLIEKIKRWEKLGVYPGYTEEIEEISLPATQMHTTFGELEDDTKEFESISF